MNRLLRWLGVFGLLVGLSVGVTHSAGVTDLVDYCTGKNNSNCPFKVDANGNITTTSYQLNTGQLLTGVSGTAAGALSSATNQAFQIPVLLSTNSVTGGVSQGMVLVSTIPTSANQFTVVESSNVSAATNVVGVADAGAALGAVVNLDFSGVALVLTTGAVTTGDLLVSTATWNGIAFSNNSAGAGTIIGTALNAGTANTSPNLIRTLLHH